MEGTTPSPGAVISDRFRVERVLGEGGMGEVWEAVELATGQKRALKFLKNTSVDDERKRRFLREARAAMAIDDPHVVRIHAVEDGDQGQPYLVMDLLEGETLRVHLDRLGRLPLRDALAIFMPILSAVGAAHAAGIVHRDLKPENVFLANEQGVRVLDFGVAKFGASVSTPALTESGDRLGTPRYMAPEQARGSRDVDHRVDIWALGIMLWEALAGRHPIVGDNVGSIYKAITLDTVPSLAAAAPDVPEDVAALVSRMLAREAANRPNDLREVADVLGRHHEGPTPTIAKAATDTAIQAERRNISTIDDSIDGTTLPSRDRRSAQRRVLIAAVVIVLAAIATFVAARRATPSVPPPSASP